MHRAVHVQGMMMMLEVIAKPYVDLMRRQVKGETTILYLSAPPL
jgi:hypothetical protein